MRIRKECYVILLWDPLVVCSPKAHFIPKMDVNFSPESVNCTTTNIADSNNGLEMRESSAKNENPEELTELTEHLRRHTTQQGTTFEFSRALHNSK